MKVDSDYAPIIVNVVQLSPRRGFDLVKTLRSLQLLGNLYTDLSLSRNHLRFIEKINFAKTVRWDLYKLEDIKHIHNQYISKILMTIAGFTPERSLLRLLFYILAQVTLQLSYLFPFIYHHMLGKSKNSESVFCFDTGSFLIAFFFKIFNVKNRIYLEQCVSPRKYQKTALCKYSPKELTFSEKLFFNIQSLIEDYEHNQAYKIISPSRLVCNQLVELGCESSKIIHIPYSFECKVISNAYDLSHRLNDDQFSCIHICFVGNDYFRKGFPNLLNALNVIDNTNISVQNIHVHVCGKPGSFDITQYAHSFQNIKLILHGKLNQKQLYDIYKKSHIFVSPSFLEGSAITILEAAYFGNCIIASYESGCNFEEETEYLVFRAGDDEKLATLLKETIENHNLRLKLATNSSQALQRFSHSIYASKISNLIVRDI